MRAASIRVSDVMSTIAYMIAVDHLNPVAC